MTLTLSDCLDLVPKYWPLEPGKDRWIEGDEEAIGDDSGQVDWVTARCVIGDWVLNPYVARRPIPEAVREAEAWWAFVRIVDDDFTAVSYGERQWGLDCYLMSEEQIEALGGVVKIGEMCECGPGALMRWVLENRK